MTDVRSRLVTLVVVGSDGVLRGAMAPQHAEEPWWQEVGQVADLLPGCTVLRMLDAVPEADAPMGGSVTYLVMYDGTAELEDWPGDLGEHPLRMPWADARGATSDRSWMHSSVDIHGEARQIRAWNLSSIWKLPTADGAVWFKGVPPFMTHEAAVLQLVEGHPVPRVIAAEGHRQLLQEMEGHDGYRADGAQQHAMIEALIRLQQDTMGRVNEFLAAGVPDFRSAAIVKRLADFVHCVAPGDASLAGLVAELPERLARVDSLGPSPALVHGDAHPGNCRIGTNPPVWFDWGDSFIGSPLFDVATADRWPGVGIERWLQIWDEVSPGGARAAWEALEPVATLRQAWLYQSFLDRIEPSERIFHKADVPEYLERTRRLL